MGILALMKPAALLNRAIPAPMLNDFRPQSAGNRYSPFGPSRPWEGLARLYRQHRRALRISLRLPDTLLATIDNVRNSRRGPARMAPRSAAASMAGEPDISMPS